MRLRTASSLLLAAALPLSAVAAQQRPVVIPADDARVKRAVEMLRADNEWTLQQQASICEIEAPPFKEEKRAAEFARRLEALGLVDVRTDTAGNVIAERPGSGEGPVVVISAHLDTVFPEGTDVTVKREGGMLRAPGIGDDCRGLAVVLAVARAMNEAKVETEGTILFVGTVGEEGPGNLRGVRNLFAESLKDQVDYFISVDGTGLGLTSGAVGSHRYRVTYKGPGGHSYGAFGMPNPIHALGRAIAKVSELQVPREPRTTFSVGIVQGGTSVNSIAYEASMDVDMRSESEATLGELDAKFQAAIREALAEERARWPQSKRELEMVIDTIGLRPAGTQPDSARIVQVALRARDVATKGHEVVVPSGTNASSTDANLPISLGIPAITIDGGGVGRGAHSLDEGYNDGPNGWLGPQWAVLVVTGLAGVR
ncbi:MAG TPA: M20/M25/M40 family metallo-hydrolase [Gemmatimonadales bacterium]